MATLAAQITSAGISAPSYADVLQQLRIAFWSIFGNDANLDPDSQDGQWLAVLAQIITDENQLAIAVYQQFSPAFAQGIGLASVVKINGIRRLVPTNSTALLSIGGQVGTIIQSGIVGDNLNLGTKWALPATVVIPGSGTIDVTATSVTAGAVSAAAGTLTQILTPTLGWQTATNAGAAALGSPVEDDATLRKRQAVSTSLPAKTVVASIFAAVANVAGVVRSQIYVNDTDTTDANGVPSHSISVIAEGGDAAAIATAIAIYKSPGTGTFGNISQIIIDQNGVPDTIKFFAVQIDTITVVVTVKALVGYVSTTGTLIQAAVADFISKLSIGEKSYLNRLYAPANLNGDSAIEVSGLSQPELDVLANTFNVTAITQNGGGDVNIAFNHAAKCGIANVTVNVT